MKKCRSHNGHIGKVGTMTRKKTLGSVHAIAVTLALALAALVGGLTATPALAGSAKDGDLRVAGECTRASTSKLKLSRENGRIEVEFEVDQNRVGVRWTVTLRRNGSIARRVTRVTNAPSGSFELRAVTPDGPGADTFRAEAVSPSGERCRAGASF